MKIRNYFRREWKRYRNPSDCHLKNNYDHQKWNIYTPGWDVTKILKRKNNNCHYLVTNSVIVASEEDKVNAFADTFVHNHLVSGNLGFDSQTDSMNQALDSFDSVNINNHTNLGKY